MRYLITGHTGFKGAWLSMWLASEGHEVSGVALDPEPESLFERTDVRAALIHDIRGDIRDPGTVRSAIKASDPEIVIHLAAQSLVRESYRNPRWTLETNVLGTLNVLEASADAANLAGSLIVTTDKVYRNVSQVEGYAEGDALGGEDPYSASKAMADILTHSWVTSFAGTPTAIARAGNVIGGGDVSKDRLFPDIIRALEAGQSPVLRYPAAVRPWQHVLDCLHGYLTLVDRLLDSDGGGISGTAWNFGPDQRSFVRVSEVAQLAAQRWGTQLEWKLATPEFREADLLALDARKAQEQLGWENLLDFREAVNWTVDWYKSVSLGESPRETTLSQLARFKELVSE